MTKHPRRMDVLRTSAVASFGLAAAPWNLPRLVASPLTPTPFRRGDLVGVRVAWTNHRLLDSGTAREPEPLVSAMEQLATGEWLARGGEVEAALAAFDAASRASDRLTIDPEDAIADFEFWVVGMDPESPARAEREAWIAALRAGQNPFTADVLERWRG